MNPLPLIALIAVLVLLAVWVVRRKPRGDRTSVAARPVVWRTSGGPVAPPSADSMPAAAREPTPATPASLLDFEWQTAESLPDVRRELILDDLKRTPPPPPAFHQLVSPDFVAKASSAELADLVIGVPQAATRVLARVNSAFYGLQQPVGSVGQAITFLGLNSVRSICLQYMMETSFKAHTPALRQRFDQLWAASAIGCELAQKLAQRLQLPEAGGIVTEVALSSLGHFAAATLTPNGGAATSTQSLLARVWSEQEQLGVPAAEIGAMQMRAWDLPEVLVEEVRAIDRMLVTPAGQLEPQLRLRLAVSYISARLGERLARGDAVNLGDFEQCLAGDDFFHLRAGLAASQQRRLKEALQAPDLARAAQTMLVALREPHAH